MTYSEKLGCLVEPVGKDGNLAAFQRVIEQTFALLKPWYKKVGGLSSIVETKDPMSLIPEDMKDIIDTPEKAIKYLETSHDTSNNTMREYTPSCITLEDGNKLGTYISTMPEGKATGIPKELKTKYPTCTNFKVNCRKEKGQEGTVSQEFGRLSDGSFKLLRITTGDFMVILKKNKTDKQKEECDSPQEMYRPSCKALCTMKDKVFTCRPKKLPTWLSEGAGCQECGFNPSTPDAKIEKGETKCSKNFESSIFVNCILDGQEVVCGPFIWELTGAWGTEVMRGSFGVKKKFQLVKIGPIYSLKGKDVPEFAKKKELWAKNFKKFLDWSDGLEQVCQPGDPLANKLEFISVCFNKLTEFIAGAQESQGLGHPSMPDVPIDLGKSGDTSDI